MLYQVPPPAPVIQAVPELPLLPTSDPTLLKVFEWTLARSPALQQLMRQLAVADRKARYRLVPSFTPNYGSLSIQPTKDFYDIDVRVSILPWRDCGDALEPWVATALYLAMEMASRGRYQGTPDPQVGRFKDETRNRAFDFQVKVRQELMAADPERLKDLPDGGLIWREAFRPGLYPPRDSKAVVRYSVRPVRRPLPAGID